MLKRGFQFAPGYRLQEFLGRGQFGQVWRATAPGGAAAAVKFIDLSDGQGQKEYDGVRRVKQIRHANLMPITAIWLLDGEGKVIEEAPDEAIETIDLSLSEAEAGSSGFRRPEIEPSWLAVSMLLGGMSLQQRLRECVGEGLPGIPPKELISYMDESAKGIDFLNAPQHDLGEGPIAIQHSDIKPANIVLIGSSAVVCDFGLARILTRNQVTATSAAGTPAYMAPEAISGKPARTSDQYSLAVTYYHLRTGALPVNDGSLWEVLDAHRLGKLNLGLVSQAEQEVLRKATDLKWENRFDSNLDMVDALRDALRSEGQTKPSFVPNRSDHAAAENQANTPTQELAPKSLDGDPTATLDLQATDTQSDDPSQSFTETQPFVQAETPTDAGFLQEKIPALDPSAVTDSNATGSVTDVLQRSPKAMAIMGAAATAIVLLGYFAITGTQSLDPGTEKPVIKEPREQDPITAGTGKPDPTKESSAMEASGGLPQAGNAASGEQLVRDAVAIMDSDANAAIQLFKQAVAATPRLLSPEPQSLAGHKLSVLRLLQNNDGSQLISIADDHAPFLWDMKSGFPQTPTRLLGHANIIESCEVSPDGQRLVAGSLNPVARLWSLQAKNDEPLELQGKNTHNGYVTAVAWHPSDPIVVTATDEKQIGVWKLGRSDAEHPAGTVEASSIFRVDHSIHSLIIDPSGKWLAVLPTDLDEVIDVHLYRWEEIESTFEVKASPEVTGLGASQAKRIAFLNSNRSHSRLVVGDTGGQCSIYTLGEEPNLEDRTEKAHAATIDVMKVSRTQDKDIIVTGSVDGSVHWWSRSETRDQRVPLDLTSGAQPITCVDVSADGRWVAAGTGGSVWLWDTQAGKQAGLIDFAAGASVESVAIDRASKWLIAGCDDGVVRMWDLRRAKLLAWSFPSQPGAAITVPMKTIDSTPLTSLAPKWD